MGREFTQTLKSEYEELEHRLRGLRADEESTRGELAEKLRVISEEATQLEARQRHIQALLALEGSPNSVILSTPEAPTWKGIVSLADEAFKLLQEAGHELHYRDIAAGLLAKGITVPGREPASNLVAHIYNDPRLVRPKRGVYGLKEWFPKGTRSAGTRKKRRTRRKRQQRIKEGVR